MISRLRVACVQMDAGEDFTLNLKRAIRFFLKAIKRKSEVVVFPENFLWRGRAGDLPWAASCAVEALKVFSELARAHRVYILLGSVIEKAGRHKFYNTSFLISPAGKTLAKYRKIHLFDSGIKGARVRESRHITPGTKAVVADIRGIRSGLSICYDLRFPELFRELSSKGCRLFFVPSNFTETTGRAHWEMLLKARAVENLAFVIAPGLSGRHPENGIKSFGTSLIIDPWGRVLARANQTQNRVILADLDFKAQAGLRRDFPVLKHRFFWKSA